MNLLSMAETCELRLLYVVIHFSLSNVTAVIIFYGVLINGCR